MNGRPLRLLVIESNPADAYLIAEALKQAGLTSPITVIDDGAVALSRLETDPAPDLIFLDLHVPPVSGLEVLEKVRAHPKLCATPVVIMSGSENSVDIQQSYALGANCYIIKPTNLNDFLRFMQIFCDFWTSVATLPPRPC